MPIVFQPPFVATLVVLLAGFIHSLLGPWPTILSVPVLGWSAGLTGFFGHDVGAHPVYVLQDYPLCGEAILAARA